MKKTYDGAQYDDIEKLLDDAERLITNKDTRIEGKDLLALAKAKIVRERNRMEYAALTNQTPNIPPLEPAKMQKKLKYTPDKILTQ